MLSDSRQHDPGQENPGATEVMKIATNLVSHMSSHLAEMIV